MDIQLCMHRYVGFRDETHQIEYCACGVIHCLKAGRVLTIIYQFMIPGIAVGIDELCMYSRRTGRIHICDSWKEAPLHVIYCMSGHVRALRFRAFQVVHVSKMNNRTTSVSLELPGS